MKMKLVFIMLMIMCGIFMFYYGIELGMIGSGGVFGEGGCCDFFGGWFKD